MSEGSHVPSPEPAVPEKPKSETLEEVIRANVPEVLKSISPDKKAALARVSIERTISMRVGPLPTPEELSAYNSIIPNGAERILTMAENQAAHRIDMEKIVITSQQGQSSRGQIFALIIAIAGLTLSTYAAIHGQQTFGSIIGGTTLVSLVSAFLYSKHAQKQDLAKKKPQVEPSLPEHQQIQNHKKKFRNR